ncbi:MAG: C40 family peptidase [Bacteroidales bacterium]|nr:C40 family peptidase [Bacteroidales bacterium]
MKYGFCEQAVVPVRSLPGDQYEMSNQLLFGDVVFVKDVQNDWLLIESADDRYEGWADKKQIQVIDQNLFESLRAEKPVYSLELSGSLLPENGEIPLLITRGARLPGFSGGRFTVGGQSFLFTGKVTGAGQQPSREQIIQVARLYAGTPYLWGGRSAFGIDCSGFTQIVFKMCGMQLQRDTSQQVGQGETVNLIHEALPADLAFFENKEGNINHVGILLDKTHIIHASGIVRIDKIDHEGIFNEDDGQYSHQLRVIKRLLR